MTKFKYTRAPEVLWIIVSIMSLGAALHKNYYFGFTKSWYFYGFVLLCLLMWFAKREIRKKREKEAE